MSDQAQRRSEETEGEADLELPLPERATRILGCLMLGELARISAVLIRKRLVNAARKQGEQSGSTRNKSALLSEHFRQRRTASVLALFTMNEAGVGDPGS